MCVSAFCGCLCVGLFINFSLFVLSFLLQESQGPDGQPGYQHVCRLAKALVEVRHHPALSESRVDRLVELWQALPEPDKRRLVYPARHQERLVRGRFKAIKTPGIAGRESVKRYVLFPFI